MKAKFLVILPLIIGVVAPWLPQTVRAQAFDDFAPVVVKTVPEALSTDVPPGEFEVKVTFSKPMMDQSWSWCTVWDDSNPQATVGPQYSADRRTCSMRVKLEPGKCYGYWLNTERFRHFQDPQHRAAVPYLLVFSTKGWHPGAKGDAGEVAGASPASAPPPETIEVRLNRALSESSPGKREAELNQIEQSIAVNDIPAALAFLARKGQTSIHSPFGDLAGKWASKDAAAAIAWGTNVPDADIRKNVIVNMMKGWTQASPEAAAAYAAALPADDDLREKAVLMVANEWSFRDARSTADWVGHLPKGPLQVKAAGPVLFWGPGQAPAALAEMLDTIGDKDLIQRNGETVASLWLKRDDAAARAWIEKSPLSEEVKQRLLNSNE
jgi:hypothetical protein